MHLVQILLPLYDNHGRMFATDHFDRVRDELTEAFGGVTAYRRSPAEGLWKQDGAINRDEVIIFEVMAEELDNSWWHHYREELAARFSQQELVIRAIGMVRL